MPYLLVRVLFSISFSHLLRLAQVRTRRPLTAVALNYLLAAGACAIWVAAVRVGWLSRAVGLGAFAGVTYVTSMALLLPVMRRSGVSVVAAVTQLSMMLPVGVGIWRFHELPSVWQTAGIALTLLALPILSATSAVDPQPLQRRDALRVLLLFLSAGSSQVAMKEFAATCPSSELALYSAALFGAATVATGLWIAITGETGRAGPLVDFEKRSGAIGPGRLGLALGAANLLQLVCLLRALELLPAVLVFPISAALGILFNAFVSILLWRERPTRGGWVGFALAIAAVLLLNRR